MRTFYLHFLLLGYFPPLPFAPLPGSKLLLVRALLRHRCAHEPHPSPVAMEPVAEAERGMREREGHKCAQFSRQNSPQINAINPLSHTISVGEITRTARGNEEKKKSSLGFRFPQRGWKELRVILRNANRPFPHCCRWVSDSALAFFPT